jgi:transcription antitermination factor NusG
MAVAALKYRGFAPYCPTQKQGRRYSDRIKLVDVPVFPGYVFCRFDVRQKLPVISSPGVGYIVGSANGPTAIPEQELMNVQRMLQSGASAARSLVNGQRVLVTSGPLAGVEGTLVRDSEKSRLVVSIQLLSQGASIEIDRDDVSELEEHEVTHGRRDLGSQL